MSASIRRTAALLATVLGLALAAPSALADPPAHARAKGAPAHAGGPHGAPPGWVKNAWRKGDRIPLAEIDGYWVDDYPRYRLHAPPPGHRWVRQADDRYLLVAVASGLIAEILTR